MPINNTTTTSNVDQASNPIGFDFQAMFSSGYISYFKDLATDIQGQLDSLFSNLQQAEGLQAEFDELEETFSQMESDLIGEDGKFKEGVSLEQKLDYIKAKNRLEYIPNRMEDLVGVDNMDDFNMDTFKMEVSDLQKQSESAKQGYFGAMQQAMQMMNMMMQSMFSF